MRGTETGHSYGLTAGSVNAFRDQAAKPNFPGLLIDFDHFSLDRQKPNEAGWRWVF